MTEHIPVGWAYLPLVFTLGALHALEPGHGKSLVSAYLLGGKHGWGDAVILGIATTVSHTALIFGLGLASFWIQDQWSTEALQHGVTQAGAAVLLIVGLYTAWRAAQDLRHGHAHGHQHGHGEPRPAEGTASLILIGLANGALPCPGALAALLLGISLGQVALGLLTVFIYSLGLALTLCLMGIAVVEAGRRVRVWLPEGKTLLWMPVISGFLVSGAGLWLLLFPHPQV